MSSSKTVTFMVVCFFLTRPQARLEPSGRGPQARLRYVFNSVTIY